MVVSCRTFSLGHVLTDYVFGATIAIAVGDGDGGHKDGHYDVCRADKSGSYCAAKTTPLIKTFGLRMLQHPLKPATPVDESKSTKERCSHSKAATMVY